MQIKKALSRGWMCWIFLILFLGVGQFRGDAAGLAPKIEVLPERYDFGEITSGQTASHPFVIKNTGKADLLLDHVYASCGCSQVRLQAYQVKPGEQITMEVFLDTHGKADGDFSGTLEIRSNAPQEPVKTIYLFARVKNSRLGENSETSGWKKISPQQYMTSVKKLPGAVLVDVRSREEYREGHIAGSKLIPLDSLSSEAEIYFRTLDTPIIVYCRSGKRSRQAAQKLVAMGYTKIYDMGGIIDWPYQIEH